MIACRTDFAFASRADHVSSAVSIAAQERSTSVDPFLLVGFHGIKTIRWALGVPSDLAAGVESRVVIVSVPIAAPFPHVATHVVKSKGVWSVLAGWGDACETIQGAIATLDRESALVDVRLVFLVELDLVTPSIQLAGFAASCCKLPFCFGGKSFVGPFGVSFSVLVGHMGYGVIVFAFDAALGTRWMAPVGTRHVAPPLEVVVEFDGTGCGFEHRRACDEVFFGSCWEFLFGRFDFSNGHIPGGFDELAELSVGDFALVHPETIDVDAMDWDCIVGDAGQTA